ncbi:glycosyltransferase family 4 protein [Paraclostridium bifermentans]|uniref:glycosyltransferase family 4 protein n=1 Tax=Paraclostridium bifermentans TaxID=1490 RepID=UPI001898C407|nr:glycosyltransferase family 4 protein [Paraclostridium bifermentans]
MKNILFLHSSSDLYGSDRSLLNLVKNLDKEKFKISVVLPCEGPLVEEIKKIQNVNVIIKEIAVLRRKNLSIKGIINYIYASLNSMKFLIKIVKNNNIDIIYTNTSVVFSGGIIAKLLRKKSVWHVREIITNGFERKIVSFIVNKFSDVIIANSKATGDSITKSKKKLKIVYNAIESNGDSVKPQIDNKDVVTIGMAGRINRWKGQKLFVDSAVDVLQKFENVNFLIAGDVYKGEEHILCELKEYIRSKGIENKIEFLGQVNDMNRFYKSLDIFILPSTQPEPFGLVVIEAMDNELPVIATNHGGPTEIIDNGENGYLVDYKNSAEMSSRMLELVANKNLRKHIGLKAKQKRNDTFTITKYVENISQILSEV